MQQRHTDPRRYFNEQARSTAKHIIPFIENVRKIEAGMNVLEIGCGEAGNLMPFLERGCFCTGVDYSTPKIETGKSFYAGHPQFEKMLLISDDIYNTKEFEAKFDIIILKDVIEHIHDQDKFLGLMKNLMAPDCIVFFAFPPWQNPFGGHQQICENKVLALLPYFHLLPARMYRSLLKIMGESNAKISSLLEIKETGISIERFENIYQKNGYVKLQKTLFFINPNYDVKFGLKPRKLTALFANLPVVRNFLCTCGYYLIAQKKI